MGVSKNNGTSKSSILIGFSIVNHPFWGTPIFGNTHIDFVDFLSLFFHALQKIGCQGTKHREATMTHDDASRWGPINESCGPRAWLGTVYGTLKGNA